MTDMSPITEFFFSSEPISSPHERHTHNVYQMIYVTKGSLYCEIAGNKVECQAPAVVFIGNYEPHVIQPTSDEYERYVITLDPYKTNTSLSPETLHSVFSFHPAPFEYSLDVSKINGEIDVLVSMLYREWQRKPRERLPGGIETLLSTLLYRLQTFSPSHFSQKRFGAAEMTVASVRKELECNFAKKLDLGSLAKAHHVSRYYLAHIFKSVTGYSLKEYLMLCRISFACQQLSGDTAKKRPISKIAEESGFHDMSNFSRYFKEITGMSPSDFRKRASRA